MKSSLTAAAFVILSLLTPLVSAQDRAPPDTDKQLSQMQKDMNAMLVQIAKLRQQSQLRKNVNAMQRQLEDLESTTDPKERQALLRAHMRTLEEQMQMVRSMTESEGGSPAKQEPAGGVLGIHPTVDNRGKGSPKNGETNPTVGCFEEA